MKLFFKIALISLILTSCASENEQKGLDEIARIYNAKVSFSKGFNSSVGKKTIKRFNIKVSESKMLDTLPFAETSSNITLTAYNNFNEDEKNNYTDLYVEFINSNNDTLKYNYPVVLLELLSKKQKAFTVFSEGIKNKSFEQIEEIKNKEEMPNNISDYLKNYTKVLNETYRNIIDYKPTAIATIKMKNRTMVQYVGYFVFSSGKYLKYAINIDMAEGKDEMVGFKIYK